MGFRHVAKMSADVRKIFDMRRQERPVHAFGENHFSVQLVGKITTVVDLAERLGNLVPVDLALIRQGVLVVAVVVIVNVEGLQAFVTERADEIPCAVVALGKSDVTDIQTGNHIFAVQRIDVANKFGNCRAGKHFH